MQQISGPAITVGSNRDLLLSPGLFLTNETMPPTFAKHDSRSGKWTKLDTVIRKNSLQF